MTTKLSASTAPITYRYRIRNYVKKTPFKTACLFNGCPHFVTAPHNVYKFPIPSVTWSSLTLCSLTLKHIFNHTFTLKDHESMKLFAWAIFHPCLPSKLNHSTASMARSHHSTILHRDAIGGAKSFEGDSSCLIPQAFPSFFAIGLPRQPGWTEGAWCTAASL